MIRKIYDCIVGCGSFLQAPLLLVLRLYWGWQFVVAGSGKFGKIPMVAGFFGDLGIPLPTFNAYLVGTVESVGGALLLLGLFARLAAIPLSVTMIVAFLTAHREAVVMIFSDPGKFLSQDPFLFLLVCLLTLAFGPGRISLDALIRKKKGCKVHGSRGMETGHGGPLGCAGS